jgi:hypothetical protein
MVLSSVTSVQSRIPDGSIIDRRNRLEIIGTMACKPGLHVAGRAERLEGHAAPAQGLAEHAKKSICVALFSSSDRKSLAGRISPESIQ